MSNTVIRVDSVNFKHLYNHFLFMLKVTMVHIPQSMLQVELTLF